MERGVLRIGVDADRSVVHNRLRQEAGFGLLELLMAMTILNIGILAVVGAFNSGAVMAGLNSSAARSMRSTS